MTGAPWPCSTCDARGTKNLGNRGYCAAHLADFYRRRITPEIWMSSGGGLGLPELARPDVGEGFAELRCSACGATWVGAAFVRCSWCEDTIARMVVWQAESVLTPPDVDPDDSHYEARMGAWADRLARAVQAGIVTEHAARTAWSREVGRVAA